MEEAPDKDFQHPGGCRSTTLMCTAAFVPDIRLHLQSRRACVACAEPTPGKQIFYKAVEGGLR